VSKPHGTKEFWLAELRAEAGLFRAAVGAAVGATVGPEGALAADVPSCPGWTVADLVRHLGGVYGWVHWLAGRGVTTRPEMPSGTRPESGDDPGDPLAWWDERYAALFAMLDALDPSLPAWNWAPQPKRAEFWHRRMAHETAVHRWDAQMAVGLSEPIESKYAADGITEVLDTWLPAGKRKGPLDRTGLIALSATDLEQVWHVRVRGEAIALLDTDTLLDDVHHERVVARGTTSDLMLALYGRVPFDVLDVAGDATLLPALLTG
jgi:uncharacterized protein (TIGR03083 family)